MPDFDAALAELYQAPHGSFVDERKRLAAALKAAGDKAAAAALAKRTRPTISAWVVNQLWWHARDAFAALMSAAARLRDGDLAANAPHRDALAKLRLRAAAILADAGHAATETILRRVTQTLSAVAATGTWEPDAPGTLSADRDPPGFDAALLAPTVENEEGAAAARRAVEQTEHAKRRAAASVAAAKVARAAMEAGEASLVGDAGDHIAESVAASEAAADEARIAESAAASEAAAREAGPPHRVAWPTTHPKHPKTPPRDVAAELKHAKAELAKREAEVEALRVKLGEAKSAVAVARAHVDELEAAADED